MDVQTTHSETNEDSTYRCVDVFNIRLREPVGSVGLPLGLRTQGEDSIMELKGMLHHGRGITQQKH